MIMSNKLKQLFNSKIANRYVIAEIGNNHNGSINLAKKLIIQAKKAGADCVKFQTFSTESLFSKKSFLNNKKLKLDSDKYTLSLDSFKILKKFSTKNNIDFTATPFSNFEVDFLVDKLNLKFIKIASMDLNNYPFIDYISKKRIPIIISTGFGSKNEIEKAVRLLKKNRAKFILLHCVSEYPPIEKNMNISRISNLEKKFNCPVGFSDHTIGTLTSITALALGAKLIEKHFTLDKKMKGWDHAISSDPKELKEICNYAKKIKIILGTKEIFRVESKKKSIIFRRSIVAAKHLSKGKKVFFSDLNFKRPGDGLEPDKWKQIVGKTLKRNIKYDQQLFLKYFRK